MYSETAGHRTWSQWLLSQVFWRDTKRVFACTRLSSPSWLLLFYQPIPPSSMRLSVKTTGDYSTRLLWVFKSNNYRLWERSQVGKSWVGWSKSGDSNRVNRAWIGKLIVVWPGLWSSFCIYMYYASQSSFKSWENMQVIRKEQSLQ